MGSDHQSGPLLCISVDAVDARDLARILSHPGLARFVAQGSRVLSMRTVAPSLTYPAHASIVTGRRPASHGILLNETEPPSGDDWDWNWYRSRIHGDTVCDAACRAGFRVASILWPTMGGAKFDWVLPEIAASRKRKENLVLKALKNGTPLFLLATELRHGSLRKGILQPYLDDFATAVALDLLHRSRGPDLLMLHLVDVDDAKHHHGVHSDETRDACDRSAARIARLLAAAGPAATVLLFGDHAQIDVHTRLDPADRLQKAGLAVRVHEAGGGALLFPEPGYEPKRDDPRLQALLEEWRREPGGGLRTWLDRAGLVAEGAGNESTLALLDAEDGFSFDEGYRATHGHLPTHPGISTTLFAKGPGILPGITIDKAEIIDIGPTIAHLLGIGLPDAEGREIPFLDSETDPRRP